MTTFTHLRDRRTQAEYLADVERGRKDEHIFQLELSSCLPAFITLDRVGWDKDGRVITSAKEIKSLKGDPDFRLFNSETGKSLMIELKGVHANINYLSPKTWTIANLRRVNGLILFIRHKHNDHIIFDPNLDDHMMGVVVKNNPAYGGKPCVFLYEDKIKTLPTFPSMKEVAHYLMGRLT